MTIFSYHKPMTSANENNLFDDITSSRGKIDVYHVKNACYECQHIAKQHLRVECQKNGVDFARGCCKILCIHFHTMTSYVFYTLASALGLIRSPYWY